MTEAMFFALMGVAAFIATLTFIYHRSSSNGNYSFNRAKLGMEARRIEKEQQGKLSDNRGMV